MKIKNFIYVMVIAIVIIFILSVIIMAINKEVNVNSGGKYAFIKLPTGEVVEGEVDSMLSGSSSVRVTINGITYMTNWVNVAIKIGED